jgi:hypothetical protein
MNPAVTQRGEQPTNPSDVERHGHTVRSPPSVATATLGYVDFWGNLQQVNTGRMGHMSELADNGTGSDDNTHHVVVVGPDGSPLGAAKIPGHTDGQDQPGEQISDMVEQPAKVMRIGTMIKQLLEEVRAAPLDDASRTRMREIHQSSVKELEEGLAPELREELNRLTLPFTDDSVPSDAELRVAQAQLVGWLEGLFAGIQTALFAQQMSARVQLEQMRRGALPPGLGESQQEGSHVRGTGQYL